jgi:hypothetical protein
MNPVQEKRIALYRSSHRIEPVAVIRGIGAIQVCRVDGIRVYRSKDGRFRHDATEVREAAAE